MECEICGSPMRRMFACDSFSYYRCQECRHVTTFPYPDNTQLKKHYEAGFNDGNYRVAIEHAADYRFAMSQIINVIDRHVSEAGGSIAELSVLDVGCFTGEFIDLLSERGADVWGVEFQPEAAEIANQKVPGRVVNIDILNDDIPFSQGQFDMITLLGIVEHVVDPCTLLNRIRPLLKDNGVLVIQTPDSTSFLAKTMGRFWPPYTPIEHIHIFSRQSLTVALRNLGFQALTCRRHWKRLSISYVYRMLGTFGPVFYRIISVFWPIIPRYIKNRRLPFYCGEMIVISDACERKCV